MDLLEYQGKQVFAKHGVPIPEGRPATTVSEAVEAAEELGYPVVIKAQVQIGGRGEGGGRQPGTGRAGGGGDPGGPPRPGIPGRPRPADCVGEGPGIPAGDYAGDLAQPA